ncbi:MAG: AAA family ATPase, partial [Clostridiales bacterium]|nr:AAA family ATPase [Clostridiales bacterium]
MSLLFFILFPAEKLTINPRGNVGLYVSAEIQPERNGSKMATVICLSNEKGGCAKSVTAANLGFGLARHGKKVLLVDADPQGSLTESIIVRPEVETENELKPDFTPTLGILHHGEGVDLMPANIRLSK